MHPEKQRQQGDGDDAKRKQQAEAFHRFQQSLESGSNRPQAPDGKYESVVDLILEAENPDVARFYTYDSVGRWIDRGDDWSARMAIEDASKRLAILSPDKAFLAGQEWDADREKYDQLSDSLTVIKDLNLFFIIKELIFLKNGELFQRGYIIFRRLYSSV